MGRARVAAHGPLRCFDDSLACARSHSSLTRDTRMRRGGRIHTRRTALLAISNKAARASMPTNPRFAVHSFLRSSIQLDNIDTSKQSSRIDDAYCKHDAAVFARRYILSTK
jgi:hypothetical protein